MHIYRSQNEIEQLLHSCWSSNLLQLGYQIDRKNSREYHLQFTNASTRLDFYYERYLDRFDLQIGPLDHPKARARSVFEFLEHRHGENSIIGPTLEPVTYDEHRGKYFFSRFFFAANDRTRPALRLIALGAAVAWELGPECAGDTALGEQIDEARRIFLANFNYEEARAKERPEVTKEYHRFNLRAHQPLLPGIRGEVRSEMVFSGAPPLYDLTATEAARIAKIGALRNVASNSNTLGRDYLETFEAIFSIRLPRAYKLFLNHLGNANAYRLRPLELSILFDAHHAVGGHSGMTEFIRLDLPFTDGLANAGSYLNIYDFG